MTFQRESSACICFSDSNSLSRHPRSHEIYHKLGYTLTTQLFRWIFVKEFDWWAKVKTILLLGFLLLCWICAQCELFFIAQLALKYRNSSCKLHGAEWWKSVGPNNSSHGRCKCPRLASICDYHCLEGMNSLIVDVINLHIQMTRKAYGLENQPSIRSRLVYVNKVLNQPVVGRYCQRYETSFVELWKQWYRTCYLK